MALSVGSFLGYNWQSLFSFVLMLLLQVKVITGEHREVVGTLISIDGVDGVLKADNGDFLMLQLRNLCKHAQV